MQESFASFWLSRMAIAVLVVYIISAIRIWRLGPSSSANRLAALLCADLGVWALQAAVSYAADDPAITVALSRVMSWSWPFFPAIGLHFALEIGTDKRRFSGRPRTAAIAAIYSGALILAYLLAGPLLRGAVRRAGYWSVDVKPGLGYAAFSAYYLVVNLLGVFFVARASFKAESRRERVRLRIIYVTHALALAGGFTTDTILESLGIDFPKVGVLWSGIWAVGLNYAMERYGFLEPLSPRDTGLLMDRFVDRSMDGIAVSDPEGRVIYWNEPMVDMTGIRMAEAMGQTLGQIQNSLSPSGEPDDSIALLVTRALVSSGQARTKRMDLEIRHIDGSPRWLQTSAFTIPSLDGDIWAFIMRDVTRERMAAEEAMERLRRQSHSQKMEALGSLAGGIAHDFNNILGGIVGAVSMIEASIEEEDRTEPLDISRELAVIQRSVKRAASSVRGLMAFTADAPHRHETFDLAEAASRVSELARRTMGRAISVAADDLPAGAWVQGDSAQVEQMILNLAINAEHAMTTMRPTGDVKGGTIGVGMKRFEPDDDFLAAHPEARPRAYWALSISDQGVGMDERTLARAFDPFFTTKNPDQGSGLGLSMVHLIARQHDGFVTASSEPGVGSTFTVYLPGVEGVA